MVVSPLQARGIASDRLEVLRPLVVFDLGFAEGALPAPLVDASRAWAACPKPVRPEAALLAVVPADVDSPVRRDGDVSGLFFFSSRRRHTRCSRDWSSDVCSSDLPLGFAVSPNFVLKRFFDGILESARFLELRKAQRRHDPVHA